MEITGKYANLTQDFGTGDTFITFKVNESNLARIESEKIKECDKLSIKVVKYRKKRSLDANALLWKTLGEIANVLNADKWDIYLQMLKRYGKYTYIAVKPNMVESVKKQWRESEEMGEIEINGQKAIQMLCYFGSSTLDTKEFSILLNGVIEEAKELGINVISQEEIERLVSDYKKTI